MTTTATPVDVSDAELAAEAVAADPDPCLDGALPFDTVVGRATDEALPAWYMPAPMAGVVVGGWRRGVVVTFIAALLLGSRPSASAPPSAHPSDGSSAEPVADVGRDRRAGFDGASRAPGSRHPSGGTIRTVAGLR